MFYFLIFHTSISASKDIDRKSLTTFLYGSVMYIILHAILSSCEQPFLQVIRRYFWIIVGLDIVSMFFVYKTILDTTETGSVLKDKLFNLLEGLADTSMYSANPIVNIDMPPTAQLDTIPSPGAGGILKKNVRIDETNNQVFQIEPINTAAPIPAPNKQQPPEPDINKELAQLAEEFHQAPVVQATQGLPPPIDTKPVKPTQSPFPAPLETRKQKSAAADPSKSVNVDAEYSNRMKEYGSGVGIANSPIASTSISEIQKKRIAANSTNDILQNRDQLSNEDIEKIKLNYDPNDVLKLYGYGNMSDLQAGNSATTTSASGDNDDMQSMVSGTSDIGSAFDIDLAEFESTL